MALSAQPLPDDLQQAINQARQKAGEFYQFTEDQTPLLIQSQDGTASGKTSVFFINTFVRLIRLCSRAKATAIWFLLRR